MLALAVFPDLLAVLLPTDQELLYEVALQEAERQLDVPLPYEKVPFTVTDQTFSLDAL